VHSQGKKIKDIIDPAFLADVDFSQEKEEFERLAY